MTNVVVIALDGKVVARSTLNTLKTAAQNTFGDSTRWPDLLTV